MRRMKGRGFGRRQFLKSAALATAAPLFVTSTALGAEGRPAATDRIVMGAIGLGGRGSSDLRSFMSHSDVQMVAVCDVKRRRRQAAQAAVNKKYKNKDCKAYIDMFDVLGRSDIDAMLIATGDNWHSLAATLTAKAGKDMYCEKPLSVTVSDSRSVAETMRRYGTVFQCGTQRRSVGNFVFAVNLARSGKLGKLHTVRAEKAPWWIEIYDTVLPAQPEPPRDEFDWKRWLGVAQWRPYNSKYPGRRFWGGHIDFAGGSITEWGSHTVDLCQWANDADNTSPVEYEPAGKNGVDVVARYENGVKLIINNGLRFGSCPVRFEGDEGWVETGDSGRMDAHPKSLLRERRFGGGYPIDGHARNFLDCVKTRQPTVAGADGAHHSVTACHIANICKRLGRPVKWDPVNEKVIGDDEADRLTTRACRQPWRM